VRIFFQNGGQHFVGLTNDNRAFGDWDAGLLTVRIDGRDIPLEEYKRYVSYLGRGISIKEY